LAGCHADEPVGPRLLALFCRCLARLPDSDRLVTDYEWWIVPHINPDGQSRNAAWQHEDAERYGFVEYLEHRVRELPGDDIEFGFPENEDDAGARPENVAAYNWWRSAGGPFSLHVSLHGMGHAAGPWFLVEAAWKDRFAELKSRCVRLVSEMGYLLHDVERNGEKGFFRLGRGFCTRPDSRYMRSHFLELGDEETASKFRPSSMETIRSLGGDALTLVSEMPLFLTPGVGVTLGPPDPEAQMWKERIADWSLMATTTPEGRNEVAESAAALGLTAMPVRDQMKLQLGLIAAGIEQVELENTRSVR